MAKGDNPIVNLMIQADIQQAKAQLKELQDSLTKLGNIDITQNFGKAFQSEVQQSQKALAVLKTSIESATKMDVRKLDFAKFEQQVKQSGYSIQELQRNLANMGAEGQQALVKLNQVLLNSETSTLRLSKQAEKLKESFGNTFRWMVSSTALHAFQGAIQDAYRYAQDLNKSLNSIRIVTGQSAEEMAQFASYANKTAQILGTSTTHVTDAALIYYQQGIRDQEEIAKRTETTIKLANVTRQSADEVSSQLTAIWNNFDDGSETLESYADKITALGAATASSSAEIAEGLQKFAAVADTVGLSYDQATAALATVVAQTRQSADIVGTAFKTIFARMESLKLGETLEDETTLKEYSEALLKVGVNIKDSNGELRNMDNILDDLGAKWKDLNQDQKVALAQTVAGVRQYNQLIALLDSYDDVLKNVNVARGAEGTLQKQQETYAESWEAASLRVKAAWEDVVQDLIDDKFFIKLTDGLGEFVKLLNQVIENMGGYKGLLVQLAPILTAVYNDKIIEWMKNASFNLKTLIPQERARLELEKENAIAYGNAIAQRHSEQIGLSSRIELEYQNKMAQLQKDLTQEQKTQLDYQKDMIVAQAESLKKEEEKLATLKEEADTQRFMTAPEYKTAGENLGALQAGQNIVQNINTTDVGSMLMGVGQMINLQKLNSGIFLPGAEGGLANGQDVRAVLAAAQIAQQNYDNYFKSLSSDGSDFDETKVTELQAKLKEKTEDLITTYSNNAQSVIEDFNKKVTTVITPDIKNVKTDEEVQQIKKIIEDGKQIIGTPQAVPQDPKEYEKMMKGLKAYSDYEQWVSQNPGKRQDPQGRLKVAIGDVSDEFKTYSKETGERIGGSATGLKNYLANIFKGLGYDFDPHKSTGDATRILSILNPDSNKINVTSVEDAKKIVQEKEEELRLDAKIKIENQLKIDAAKQQTEEIQEQGRAVTELAQKTGKEVEQRVRLQTEEENITSQLEMQKQKMEEMRVINAYGSTEERIMGLTRAMTSYNSIVNIITNTIDKLRDSEASSEEKIKSITQAIPTLVMQILMLKKTLESTKAVMKVEDLAKYRNLKNDTTDTYRTALGGQKIVNTKGAGFGRLYVKGDANAAGATTGLGTALVLVAMVVAAIKTFQVIWEEMDKEFKTYAQNLKQQNEENTKWFEDNENKLEAARSFEVLDGQLKHNIITTEEYQDALLSSAKALEVHNADLLAEAGAYELLAKNAEKAQKELEEEANEKAARNAENAKILMTAGDQGTFDNVFGSLFASFTGNYDNHTAIKTLGAGLDVDDEEEALLKELKALQIEGVDVNIEEGTITWLQDTMSLESLAQLAEFFAEVQAHPDKYGGDSDELIDGINRLNEDMASVAADFRLAVDREKQINARNILQEYDADKGFERNNLSGFFAASNYLGGRGVDQEIIDQLFSQYFINEKQQSGYATLASYFSQFDIEEEKLIDFVKAFEELDEQSQQTFLETAQKAPDQLNRYLKSFDDTTEHLTEGMGQVQFILDNINLQNFEQTFSTVQQTLDDLEVGKTFANQKELENFAKKFGITDIDKFLEDYGSNFTHYADDSYAFTGNKEQMMQEYEANTIESLQRAYQSKVQNEQELSEILDGQSYEDYISHQSEQQREASEALKDNNLRMSQIQAGWSGLNVEGVNSYQDDELQWHQAHAIYADAIYSILGLEQDSPLPDEIPIQHISTIDGKKVFFLSDDGYDNLLSIVQGNISTVQAGIAEAQSNYDVADTAIAQASVRQDNINLAKKYENLSGYNFSNASMSIDEIQDKYNQYGGVAPKGFIKQASINTAEDLGIKKEDLEDYAEQLQEIIPALKDDEDAAYDLALANQRLNLGIQDLHDNIETWTTSLSTAAKGTEDYAIAMNGLEKSLQNIFSTNDDIDDDFILNHLEDIKKAAEGNTESINKLRIEYSRLQATEAQISESNLDNGLRAASEAAGQTFDSVNSLWDALYTVPWDNINVGATLDINPVLRALQTFLTTTKMTGSQVQSILDSIGYEAELVVDYDPETKTTYVKSIKNARYTGKANQPTDKSKKKSSGSSRSKKDKKDYKDEFERYYTINRQIQDQIDEVERLGKAKDRAWGKAKLDLLDKESDALQTQIDLQNEKIRQVEQYYKYDQERLNFFGAQYDENGVVTNYDEMVKREVDAYNKAVDRYNNGGGEGAFSLAEDRYNKFKEILKQYDETNQLWQSEIDKLTDLKNEYYDMQLEKIQTKVEMDIEVDDSDLKVLEYELDRIRKKAFSTAEAIAKIGEQLDVNLDKQKVYNDALEDILANHGIGDIGEINNLDESTIANLGFTQDEIKALEEYNESLMDTQKELDQLEEEILNGPVEAFKEWNDEFDYQEDKIENNINLLKQYKNIADLIYSNSRGVTDQFLYGIMNNTYNNMVTGVGSAYTEWQANKAALAEAMAAYEESIAAGADEQTITLLRNNLREMEEMVDKSRDDMLKKTEEALKQAEDLLKQFVENAAKAAKEAFSATDWDMTKFDRLKTLDDEYLDDYEKIYELSKLTRDVNNSMDSMDTIRGKERLKEITQEIAEIEESNKEISQYEVDALRKKYELRLAEIALEDAQAAKNTVRMSRDNDGNWSYVYTADESKVDKARQNYEDKLYEYQKLNSEFIKNQQENFLKLEQEYTDAMQKIAEDSSLNEEDKLTRLQETQAYYQRMAEIMTDQLGIALDRNSELYHKDWLDYSKMTDYKISKLEDYQTQIENTYTGYLQPNIESAMDLLTQFTNATVGEGGYFPQIVQGLEEFKDRQDEILHAAGTTLEDYAMYVEDAMYAAGESSIKASDEVSYAANNMRNAFDEVIAKINELNQKNLSSLRSDISSTVNSINSLVGAYKDLSQQAYNTQQMLKSATAAAIEFNKVGGGGGGGIAGGNTTTLSSTDGKRGSIYTSVTSKSGSPAPTNTTTSNSTQANLMRFLTEFTYAYPKGSKERDQILYTIFGSMDVDIIRNNINSGRYILSSLRERAKQYAPKIWAQYSFDTGGYTGSWGSEGRWAMLHQKELVLNAHDTENMLNTIQMVRDIVASIDTRAAAAGAMNINAGYAGNATAGAQDLNQNVHIEASFPNATDHNEIELALTNLVNRASQYAGRKKP